MQQSFVVTALFGALICGCSATEDLTGLPPKELLASASSPELAPAENDRAYVAIAGSNEVAVLDEATHTQVDAIEVGKGPAIILTTPDRKKLFTANWTDNTVSAIDVATASATNIALPGRPYVIAISPDGSRVYAGLSSNQIAVIDVATTVVEKFLPTAELPASIIVSPDGETLYVAELSRNTLRAVSAETGAVVKAPIQVGKAPAWITISPDGGKVYTLNYRADNADDVTVVDTETFTIEANIPTAISGKESKGIIGNVTPDGRKLFVTNLGTGDYVVIDTATNSVAQRVQLDGRPVGVAFSEDGSRAYVTDYGVGSLEAALSSEFLLTGVFRPVRDGQVSIFDVETGERLGEKIRVGAGPNSVVVDSH